MLVWSAHGGESGNSLSAGTTPDCRTRTILDHNLRVAANVEDAVVATFIEEAVAEDGELKRVTLARISAAAQPAAIIGTDTSTSAISDLGPAVEHPARFLGIHFMNPAPFVAGVEVIPHAGTDPSAVATITAILTAAGKQPVTVADTTGFVVNRLQYALFSEAARLVGEGVATVADIDSLVLTSFGFRLAVFGPFAIADMAGLDVYGLLPNPRGGHRGPVHHAADPGRSRAGRQDRDEERRRLLHRADGSRHPACRVP